MWIAIGFCCFFVTLRQEGEQNLALTARVPILFHAIPKPSSCARRVVLQWLSVANAAFRYYQALPKAGFIILPSVIWIAVGK